MGRRLGIGCLSIFAVLFVTGGVLAYFNFVRPAQQFAAAAQGVGRLQQLDEQVRNRQPFSAPEDGLVDEAAVERFLGVQERIGEQLSGRLAELQAKYEELEAREQGTGLGDMAGAWADVMNLLVDAKEAQVAAINEVGFSVDEYRWVRARVLEASGHAFHGYDLTTVIAGGDDDQRAQLAQPAQAPAANVSLVEPHRDRLERLAPLAYFGL